MTRCKPAGLVLLLLPSCASLGEVETELDLLVQPQEPNLVHALLNETIDRCCSAGIILYAEILRRLFV